MKVRVRPLTLAAIVAVVAVGAIGPVIAHPPDDPFDNTIFAPIDDEGGFKMDLELTAEGFAAPLRGVVAPGEPGRMYVVDQPGKLWAVDLATGAKSVFLDVSGLLVPLGVGAGGFDERGFLGVAFHPEYASNGKLYTWTSEPAGPAPTFPTTLPVGTPADHQNVLSEWVAVDPGDPSQGVGPIRRELMRIDWPQFNHNAGDINFGPDDMLYVPTGDGGGADDLDGDISLGTPVVGHSVDGNAQKLTVPLGKILRIDVDGNNAPNGQYGIPSDNPFVNTAGAVKEIWAFGLRNPYRMSFDTESGILTAGDVGQNDIEEVNVIVKGGNYGWNRKEGTLCFDNKGINPGAATLDCSTLPPLPPDLKDPFAQYDTHHEGHSVIGGFVYHGDGLPFLKDRYVFAEWSRLFTFPEQHDNYGRLLYVQQKNIGQGGLKDVKEFKGFPEAAERLGLTVPEQPEAAFPQTLSLLGMGQDASGEVYFMGNRTGRPSGTGGVIIKLIHD